MNSKTYFCRPLLVTLLAFISIFSIGNADKLNERRILLPYNSGVPTNFTLEALTNTACYKWSSSRPDIASVRHIGDPSCARQAVVTVVSRVPKRQSSVVTAHDLKTNLQIRCDVEIDVINRVLITTTTRQIVYGELPEMIKAVAFDEKNDIFTSIGGIQFDWTISPLDIIRYRTWASSSYAAPDFVEFWESKGSKSSFVLMEGVKTGSAKIKARIAGDAYPNVEPSEISVHVVANLMLIPSNDVFLVRGAKVGFRAEISKQGPRVPLNLPLPQYYLEVTDPGVAQFDEQTNLLEATEEGHTSLVLRDRNVEGEGLSQTSTDVHVMRPSYLSLHISPGEKFALRNDTIYVISLTLHDDWHHRLYPSDNLNLVADFPDKYFEVLEQTQNGTYYLVRTKEVGATKLKASFLGAGSALLDTPLDAVQDVTIYPPITLNPPQMLLPWIPSIKPSYTVYVDALGATGEYNWETGDESMAQVKYSTDRSSRATVYTKGDGEVQISCNDVHNSLIFNSVMNIYIRPIEAIEILPSIVETHIGGNIFLPVAVLGFLNGKDGKKVYFDDCAQVKFDVEIVEKNRVRYQPDNFMAGIGERSCRSLSFECLASGNSRVWISYGPNKQITTSVIVGCYAPLTLVQPNEFAVLSLGSIIDVAFEGGPRAWAMYPEGHYKKAAASNSSVVALTEIRDRYRYNKDLHVFRTKCTGYGESTIDLEVGNVPSPTLANPAFTKSSVKIICARPETLIIRPRMKATCPQQDFVFTLEKNQDIELDVQVLDSKGNSFYNFSTLYFEWHKDGNGAFTEAHGIKEEVNGAKGYFALTRSYQELSGLTSLRSKVRGKITGYQQGSSLFGERFDVRREIELLLTDPLTIAKDSVSILKHSGYKKSITINQGSGHFSIEHTNKDIITVDFKANDKTFNVVPLAIGSGFLTISDLCLNYDPVTLPYSVVEAIDVKVDLIDKIELGRRSEGTFYVLDNRGMRLDSSLHSVLDFAVLPSNSLLTISELKTKDASTSSFMVQADRLGLSKVVIASQSDKVKSIQSASVEVQIFSPLQIIPSNITLIVGNRFQPSAIGGPQTQRNIEFTIDDSNLASVGSNGLIQAHRIGNTKLTGRVMNVNNFEYSRALVTVHVVALKKIKIWTPVNQIVAGSHMPLYLIGSSEQHETPFMFGAADPALKITWSLDNDKIASVESSFQTFGISDSTTDQIAARLEAKTIGTVTVKVTVEVTTASHSRDTEQVLQNVLLSDSVQVQVFSRFAPSFVPPSTEVAQESRKNSADTVLLLSPNAELSMHFFNHMDSISYEVRNAKQAKVVNNTELVLQAGDAQEQAQLLLYRDVHRTGLVEYYSYAVHVDKVRYLSLQFQQPLKSTKSANNIDVFPLGSELKLTVNYYDNHGRKFDAVKSNLKWFLSRNDIATVLSGPSDNVLRVRALKEGSVIIHVTDEVNQVGSYYKINVGSIIDPKVQPISLKVGDLICLRSKLQSPAAQSLDTSDAEQEDAALIASGIGGLWSTEDGVSSEQNKIVPIGSISPVHGSFVALDAGKTAISFNATSSGLSTYTSVVVKQFEDLHFDLSGVDGITTSSSLVIPLRVVGQKSSVSSKLCSPAEVASIVRQLRSSRLLPFGCNVEFDDNEKLPSLWDTEVQYSLQRGGWVCRLTPKPGLDLDNLSLFNLNVSLLAWSTSDVEGSSRSSTSSGNFMDKKTIPFLPAYQSSVRQIIVTSDSKEVRFTVNSVESVLRELTIKPSNSDILEVRKLDLIDNSLKVLVTLRNADIFSNDVSNLHLTLVSTLTNQTERISVQIKLYGTLSQLPSQILSSNFYYSTTLILFTLVIAFILYLLIRFIVSKPFKLTEYSAADKSFSNSSLLLNNSASSSPRRIVDYNISGNLNSPASLLNRTNRLSTTPQSPTSPIGPGGAPTGTPSSPKVGRPLYSTRQHFQ